MFWQPKIPGGNNIETYFFIMAILFVLVSMASCSTKANKTQFEITSDYLTHQYGAANSISDSLKILDAKEITNLTFILYCYDKGLKDYYNIPSLELGIIQNEELSPISSIDLSKNKEADIVIGGSSFEISEDEFLNALFGLINDVNISAIELIFENDSFIITPHNQSFLFIAEQASGNYVTYKTVKINFFQSVFYKAPAN